jgi:hypothetical protein
METPRPVTAGPTEFPRPGPGKLVSPFLPVREPMVPRNALLFSSLFPFSLDAPTRQHRRKAARRQATGLASSTIQNTSFDARPQSGLVPPLGGPRPSPTARLRAQEYRLRLKRFPPFRQGGRFPPIKSSTAFRALALSASLRRAQRQLTFPFWKQKLRLRAHFFSPKRNPKDSWREGKEPKANGPTETVTAN